MNIRIDDKRTVLGRIRTTFCPLLAVALCGCEGIETGADDVAGLTGPSTEASVHAQPGPIAGVNRIDRLALDLALDPSIDVRMDAVDSLYLLGTDEAVTELAAALNDPEVDVRADAVDALGDLRNGASIPYLTQALLEGDRGVREAAIDALAETGGPAAAQVLALVLEDGDAELREEAVYALGDLGATELIRFAADDPDPRVREAARDILSDSFR